MTTAPLAAAALVIAARGARQVSLRFGALAGDVCLRARSLNLRLVAFKTEVMANLPLALAVGLLPGP